MSKYGIFGKPAGSAYPWSHKTDYPKEILPDNFVPEGSNVIFLDGMVCNAPAPREIVSDTITGRKILATKFFEGDLFAFTDTDIYRHVSGTGWTSVFTAGGTTTYWSFTTFNGKLYATNNIDIPQVWNGSVWSAVEAGGIDFGRADNRVLTQAKLVTSFENKLVFLNLTWDSSFYEERAVAYSDTNNADPTDGGFDAGNSGTAFLNDGDGSIRSVGHFQDFMFVGTEKAICRGWDNDGFEFARVNSEVGCIAPGSVVNGSMGELYFYDTNGDISVFTNAYTSKVISDSVSKHLRLVHEDNIELIRSGYIAKDQQVWFAMPVGVEKDAITLENTKALVFDKGRWFVPMDISIAGFGDYTDQVNYTIDNFAALYDTFADVPPDMSFDDLKVEADKLHDVCIDYTGKIYKFDAGSGTLRSKFELTTNLAGEQYLANNKRLQRFWLWYKAAGDTVITLTSDIESNTPSLFENRVSAGLVRREYSCDCVGSVFTLEMETEQVFQFFGVLFEFEVEEELG